MKRLLGLLIVVAGVVALAGCNVSINTTGTIYGEFSYPSGMSTYYLSLAGFPSGALVPNNYYTISAGTYNVYYTLEDYLSPTLGTIYYPGYSGTGDSSSNYYWLSQYSVSAASSGDKHFQLYLGTSGMTTTGDATGSSTLLGQALKPKLGTTTVTKDGVTITITNEIVQLTDAQKAALQKNTIKQ
jgi:hypothetical protein